MKRVSGFILYFFLIAASGTMLCPPRLAVNESVENKMVENAFKLRCSGKATEAAGMLTQFLAENPDSAAASYELARTRLQIGLGNPRKLMSELPEIRKLAAVAAAQAPGQVMYRYFDGQVAFMQMYAALMRDPDKAKVAVAEFAQILESMSDLQQVSNVVRLSLVDLYSTLETDQGGDQIKAEEYASKLEKSDPIWGAKARALLLPEGEDQVAFWKKMAEKYPRSAEVQLELGRVYLYSEADEDGGKCFESVLQVEPARTTLLLDMARFYMYQVMRDSTMAETIAPKSIVWLERYLDTDPVAPMKAYATAWRARMLTASGHKEEGQKMMEEASAIDPHYSRATGLPGQELFVPPGQIGVFHRYLFLPF